MFEDLEKQAKSKDVLIKNLLEKITALEKAVLLNNKHTYGSKSQKHKSRQKNEDADDDHTRNKMDFDGTQDSIRSPHALPEEPEDASDNESENRSKEIRLYRQGKEYRTMKADKSVFHDCDTTKLPVGVQIIKRLRLYSYEHVSSIIEHNYEIIRYKTSDRKICEDYFPIEGEPEIKVRNVYKKRYIWCLVNKSARIVIYCYKNGSRGRDALRHILGEHSIMSLQSDGYNVYMYLDDKLMDIEHICCMAHARAEFKYALEQQGGDIEAAFFLDCIGELYSLEAEYEKGRLSREQKKYAETILKQKK